MNLSLSRDNLIRYSNIIRSEIKESKDLRSYIWYIIEGLKTSTREAWRFRSAIPVSLFMTSTFYVCGNLEGKKKGRECRSELRGNAPYETAAKCGTHTSVFHALRECVRVGAIFVFAYAVENLIQNAAKHDLILCAYPYGEVFALKTRAFTRSTRINEWQGYIRPSVCTRE